MLCKNVHKTLAITTTTVTVFVAMSGRVMSLRAGGGGGSFQNVNLFLSEGWREILSALGLNFGFASALT
jgi:hypothetical protein